MLSIFSSRVSIRSLEKTYLAKFFSVLYTSVVVVPISCSTFRRLGYFASKITLICNRDDVHETDDVCYDVSGL